jgi:glycosyltransferase involved in cell wall biosynthesis
MSLPSVSVVIPAYNTQDTIGVALEALSHQTYAGRIEVIVVDDGSLDKTAETVRALSSVRYVHQPNAGPASARNRGAREASGELLLFTDADCCPQKTWIEKMVAGFSAEDIGAVGGSYGIANPDSPLARVIHGEIIFRHKKLMPEFSKSFGSYNVALRRKVFESAGGFDVTYRNASGEDSDLSYRVLKQGQRIRFLKDAVVGHFHQESLARYLKEQYRHGFWRAKMYFDHPRMARGDDYTFWKDMAEVPLVLLHVVMAPWPVLWLVLACGFLVFEFVFSVFFFATFRDILFGGYVMWLRAFARVVGFFGGSAYFFINYIHRKNSIKNLKKPCEAKRVC